MNSSVLLQSSPSLHKSVALSAWAIKPVVLMICLLFIQSAKAQESIIINKDVAHVGTISKEFTTQDLIGSQRTLAGLKVYTDSIGVANYYPDSSILKKQSVRERNRLLLVGGINFVGYGGSLIVLNSTWYTGYAKTKFHTFNDSKEWLQVDKVGHAWGAYNAGKASAAMWKWTGLSPKKSALIGALSSTAFLTGIELMDAYSAKWGWSWSDFGTNFIGAGLFVAQEFLWSEQRIQFKFSFHKNKYTDPVLSQRADNLFGKPWYERMLKDYNAQTYWLSANLKSFFPKSKIPAWLNASLGYGADGMFGGFENKWLDALGNEINRSDIPRKRQFYLAPDIDFTKIKTNKKWLRTAFTFLNAFKFPAPALMMDSKGKFKAYVLYF